MKTEQAGARSCALVCVGSSVDFTECKWEAAGEGQDLM